ncbi:MAG: ATP-binding protein [Gammaproteobacteria bacterium]|nr:ATP-binding protein [Gammaproteobacteria bacterium]
MEEFAPIISRLETLLARAEKLLPADRGEPDWSALAFRWRKPGFLQAVKHPHRIELDDLLNVDTQKAKLIQNTRQFVAGHAANNALLSGSRGTGKSSLVKALLNLFADEGLRLIEVERQDLIDLPDIADPLYERPERFILFTDDLSFEANEPSYKALKAMLDGSIAVAPDNVLIYATSNRRHLMPEFQRENLEAGYVEGEIHHGEAVEEKISLSERFGLWVSFHPFNQEQYLCAVRHWLERLDAPARDIDSMRGDALRWALQRGSRSGRVAYQFARDWAGRHASATP